MRKKLLWQSSIIFIVLLLGWGTQYFIENMEPDPEASLKKVVKTTETPVRRSSGKGNALETASRSRHASESAPLTSNSLPNIAPKLASTPPAQNENSESVSIPSFSRDRGAPLDPSYNPDNDFAKSQILVLDPSPDFVAEAARMGYQLIEELNLESLGMKALRMRAPSNMTTEQALEKLSGRFPELIMDFDHNFEPSQDQSRPRLTKRRRTTEQVPSAVEQLAARKAGNYSRARKSIGWQNLPETCGTGLRLGMIDTAVDKSHPALIGQRLVTKVTHDPRARSGPANHGTAIAAMLIGKHDPNGWGGLVPDAELLAANIFEITPSGKSVGRSSSLLRAINWFTRKKVTVINVGITGANNKTLRKAMFIAKKAGMIVVAAAGNRGWKKRRAYPAGYTHVISVTAVGPYKGVIKNANRGSYIDFAAPGVRVWTAVPGGGSYKSGSSYATTYITALIGLELLRGRRRDSVALKEILAKEIIDLGKPGKDHTYGWGFIKKHPKC